MAKYIDADKLIEDLRESESRLREIYKGLKFDEDKQICAGQITTFTECILRIKNAPEVDIAEVINASYHEKNCKDCKYYDLDEDSVNYYICEHCFRCYGYADNFKPKTEGE